MAQNIICMILRFLDVSLDVSRLPKPTLFIFGDTRTPKQIKKNMGTSRNNLIFENMGIKNFDCFENMRAVFGV